MAGHGKGRKGSGRGRGRGGSRGACRGGSRGGRGGRGNYTGRGRGGRFFLSRVEGDIDNFVPRGRLSDDFISLRDCRENAPIVKLNKKLKISKLQQINDMVDLNKGDFNSVEEMSVNSMMYQRSTRKKKNSMYNEVRYTSSHREELLNKSFRKLSIEFVKAKEVYDPSKLLLEQLSKNNKIIPNKVQLPSIVDIEEELIKENGLYQNDENDEDDNELEDGFDIDEEIEDEIEDPDVHEDDDIELEEELNASDESDAAIEDGQDDEESDDQCGESSDEEDDEAYAEQIEPPTLDFQPIEKKTKRSKIQFVDDNDEHTFDLSYDENVDDSEEDDESTPAVNTDVVSAEDDDIISGSLAVDEDEFDDDANNYGTIKIGKFMTAMKTTKNGEAFIELPGGKKNKNKKTKAKSNNKSKSEKVVYMVSNDNDDMSVNDVVKHVNKKMYGIGEEEAEEDQPEEDEPEFGFLEEDYVAFDVTSIKIDNIRVSADINNQQYYVQAPSLFGFDDFQWFNRGDLLNFLIENGFPEHRFNAFIKSATGHLVRPEVRQREEEFDENEMYISDSSEDKEDDSGDDALGSKNHISVSKNVRHKVQQESDSNSDSELDEDLMEGIEDLLSMHQRSSKALYDPLEVGTKSIRVKGRKKNPQLEFNTEIDPEFQQYITEKYMQKREKRKDQREEREFSRKNNAYMLTKYPYLLEMDDILDEFKEFWKDPVRESLRFPPMDFHVNMVLKMIAEAYGYSSRKIGKGKKEYLEVRKPVKNKNREPHWDRLKKLANKRSVCFRMDVELSREEKRELRRIKGGNVAVQQMKNKGRGNFSYKEGEVVGAGAKEIDSSSIGRKLLEKMGWQMGDALGPEDNKGIIEPIKVVVKTSKKGIQ